MYESISLESSSSVTFGPYVIQFTRVPHEPWLAAKGVQLSPPRMRKAVPDLYGLVEQAGVPVMRLDLSRQVVCSDFRDAVALWKQWLVIAYGDYLYLVSLRTRDVHVHALDSYFGSLKGLTDHLLVADACRLLCFDEEASLLWSVDLGIDGVIFAVEGEVIIGEAEIDPPGGWVPFRLALHSGQWLASEGEDVLYRKHLRGKTKPDSADRNHDGV